MKGTWSATRALLAVGVLGIALAVSGHGRLSLAPSAVRADACSVVAGGINNTAAGDCATASGGRDNSAAGHFSVIAGGINNAASGRGATVGGGGYTCDSQGSCEAAGNVASHLDATVGGGGDNLAGADFATVGGGFNNDATGLAAAMTGGYFNVASGNFATVAGGTNNTASGIASTIGGGSANTTSTGYGPTIAGGHSNTATGLYAAVGGGSYNRATAAFATIGGGGYLESNLPTGNRVTDSYGTVAGGGNNQAGDTTSSARSFATVGGGSSNTASGAYATVPGGTTNTASGNYAFAAGRNAQANRTGSFIWADSNTFPFRALRPNQFRARTTGGAQFVSAIDPSTGAAIAGVTLNPGSGGWSALSDRRAKTNIAAVDSRAILERLASIPVSVWSYKTQDPSVRHIGPMSQDFAQAFGVGENDTTINTVDADGVALAAIQGLYQENQELKAQSKALQTRIITLEQARSSAGMRLTSDPNSWMRIALALAGLNTLLLAGLAMQRLGRGTAHV